MPGVRCGRRKEQLMIDEYILRWILPSMVVSLIRDCRFPAHYAASRSVVGSPMGPSGPTSYQKSVDVLSPYGVPDIAPRNGSSKIATSDVISTTVRRLVLPLFLRLRSHGFSRLFRFGRRRRGRCTCQAVDPTVHTHTLDIVAQPHPHQPEAQASCVGYLIRAASPACIISRPLFYRCPR